jgi:hypothetical protein
MLPKPQMDEISNRLISAAQHRTFFPRSVTSFAMKVLRPFLEKCSRILTKGDPHAPLQKLKRK